MTGWALPTFGVDELESYSTFLRTLGGTAESMEAIGTQLVRSLHDSFHDGNGKPAVALARLYKTHRFHDLDDDLQTFARTAAGTAQPADDLQSLTLVATNGDLPEWCDRRASEGHQAIPLVSGTAVAKLPMVAGLVDELGLAMEQVVSPSQRDALRLHHKRYDVFYVPVAKGSPSVPAQGFVEEHGIESVIGCGGVLPSGDLFAIILFTTVPVPEQVAEMFSSVALAYKAALVPFTFKVFEQA